MVEDGYAKIRSPWNSTTRSARDQAPSRRDVDRLLEDQFDSHLSPLRTGIGSRSFRLRAVRTGDGDRRLAGLLRSVRGLPKLDSLGSSDESDRVCLSEPTDARAGHARPSRSKKGESLSGAKRSQLRARRRRLRSASHPTPRTSK